MKWTKTWPKKAGWYWRKCAMNYVEPNAKIEWVGKRMECECAYCWWYGPLRPPTEKARRK